MKRSPVGSSRNPDNPPKPRKLDVRISPLRYCRSPKRTWDRSRLLKEASGRAFTSIETGAVTEYSSGLYFGGFWTAVCARTQPAPTAKNPAAVDVRKRRRLTARMVSRMQAPGTGWGTMGLAEELGELFGDRAAE